MSIWSELTRQLIRSAWEEDLDDGEDLTSALLPDPLRPVRAALVARQPGVICGLALAPEICGEFGRRLDRRLDFEADRADGDEVQAGARAGSLTGPLAAVLTVERTLLNFLGRMSGVATRTRAFVQAARAVNPDVRVLDTRKTLPGWRELDKYAVRCGGGENHRLGLYDAVLIKDNHLAGVPVEQLSDYLETLLVRLEGEPKFVEVEVDGLEQFSAVCGVEGVDIILLDNFTTEEMRAAVAERDARGLRGKVELEASGGITLERVAEIAATGVDRISVGALTHSVPALDLSLEVEPTGQAPA